ncbi:MAG: DUF2993 domain-containing protein [Synechococcales bacterium]|nr:DUF2993 domain-containing protein [Synechococcales bacterium]
MEVITILLASLFGILSPVSFAADTLAEEAVGDRLSEAEQVEVRIDTAPNYQILQGQVNRVRFAGRGLYPVPELRVEALDIETDAIDVDFAQARQGSLRLDEPLQAGIRLVLRQEDVNQALQSPAIANLLRDIGLGILGEDTIGGVSQGDIVDPRIEFLEGDRLRLQATLREQGTDEELSIDLSFGLAVQNGHQLQILEPRLVTNEVEFPPEILEPLLAGVSQQLTLRNFELFGITARLLKLEIQPDTLEVATFVRIDP